MAKIVCLDFDAEWRPIPEWPYEVSSYGQVRRSSREGARNTWAGRILKANHDKDGYAYVRLCKNGVVHDYKVHALVCLAFHGEKPFSAAECRHLDGNPYNNWQGNLTWGTAKENAADRLRHGRQARGENCPRAKLSNGQAQALRAKHALAQRGRKRVPRGTIDALAEEFSISRHGIANIVSGRGYNPIGERRS